MNILYFFLGSPPRWIATTFAFWAAVIWLASAAFATCPALDRVAVERYCRERALAVHPDPATQEIMRDRQVSNCLGPALRRAHIEDGK